METDTKTVIRDIVQKYCEDDVGFNDCLNGWKHRIDKIDTIDIIIDIENHFGIMIDEWKWYPLLDYDSCNEFTVNRLAKIVEQIL